MRFKLAASLVLLAIAGFLAGYLRREPARLVFLAVGQGDSTLLSADGVHVLIDAGPAKDGYDAGKALVLPKLRAYGVERLALIFLTHPDADHIGGTGAVLDRYPEARLVINQAFAGHPDLREGLRRWRVPEQNVIWASGLREFRFGDTCVRCYAPSEVTEDNEGSLILQIRHGRAEAAFSGDAPSDAEARASKVADWSSDLMAAGHHGSRTSTSEAWLDEVRPSTVVVSCGRDNAYGHPAEEVLARLRESAVKVHRTDLEGDLVFEPSPEGFRRR
ncbi:MAG TPA: MBL fold metallo-hydrolase [Fimbriimonas sp.]